MADTYHPQQFFEVQSPQILETSSEVPTDSIKSEFYYNVTATSTFIPLHKEIISMMELYAPGSGITWPDDLKPQYRIPEFANDPEPPPVVQGNFSALTLAF